MDAVLLSRIQFGLQAGFHFIFPPLTLGISLILVIIEGMRYKTKSEQYKRLSMMLVKMLGLIFAMGTATGIVLEFGFGTNWSNYSRLVGDIFGAPLAAEGVFAFFLESVFLGVLLFGRNKVSEKMYLISAILVAFASHLSGLWIIIANSWMQTPAGYEMVDGTARMTDFFAAAVNHSTGVRFLHTVIASWITGALFTASVSAWYLLKGRDEEYAKTLLKVSMIVFIFTGLFQFASGHMHSVQVAKTQPPKMAAFEALWETQTGAPMSLFGFPDEEARETHMEIAVPKLLSFLIDFRFDSEVPGLNETPEEEWPPVAPVYFSYHIMIALGSLFALIALLGAFFLMRGTLYSTRWFLGLLTISFPLPLLANEFGWMAAEIGRQPWVVWQVLKTVDGHSQVVPAGQILFSLIMFSLIYLVLFLFFVKLMLKVIKKGPEQITEGY